MKRAFDILGGFSLFALASFMVGFGRGNWWGGLVMLVWNLTPLLFLRYVWAKRPAMPWAAAIVLLASVLYVGTATWLYWAAYTDNGPMAGLSYVYVPIAGWLIALTGEAIMVWIGVWRAMRVR